MSYLITKTGDLFGQGIKAPVAQETNSIVHCSGFEVIVDRTGRHKASHSLTHNQLISLSEVVPVYAHYFQGLLEHV